MVRILTVVVTLFSISGTELYGEMINRYGTTAANFLEIGVGSRPNAMGEAYVAIASDLTSIYWNPAGLANVNRPSAMFALQPWVANIDMLFAAGAMAIPNIGTLGLGITQVSYGEQEVTTLQYQDGTGEYFTANDLAATVTFSRKLVSWFSFGSSLKYINSSIWHSSATAFAVDLGVQVSTDFFSYTGQEKDGLQLGMSISNYGTRMKYDGIDTYQPIDISEFEEGNYGDVAGQFRTSQWELPLLFRVGFAIKPIVTNFATITLAADALHPNNNSESVNVGISMRNTIPGFGEFSINGGIKALYMDETSVDALYSGRNTKYRATGGVGVKLNYLGNRSLTVDYAYKSMGILGNVNAFTVGISF